jgi:DNA-binding beta-propeller fold protein YncE
MFHVVLLTAGCAGTDLRTQDAELGAAASSPSWPPPPQTERIRYIQSISGPSDVGIKKSWLKRAFDTILGKEEAEERILRPYGIFADKSRIYVTDPGAHVLHVFDLKGGNYFQITEAKKEELVSPIGVAVDENGEVYLSDSVLHGVFIYDREGKYLRELGSPELFVRPTGIALDGERVYVVDTHSHQVVVFMKKNGQLISRIGKNGRERGEFNYPTNVFVRNGLLYIVDSMNFRVQVLGADGSFRSAFGKLGDGSGDFSQPKGIAVDSDGHIYVSDAHFDAVQIFSGEGRLLLGFGNTGRGPGEMSLPAGVFIDAQDRVYVADSYNNRVQVFQYLKEKK